MTEHDLRRSVELFRRAGFAVQESRFDEKCFGSWFIEVTREGLPRQRVVWDGKDGWLIVEAFASGGSWMDKWTGRKRNEQTPEAALCQLQVPVTHEWEREVERQREEDWRRFKLEQALTCAARLWEDGCYREYVRELSPYRERLSRAQLKRMDIARKRAAGDDGPPSIEP